MIVYYAVASCLLLLLSPVPAFSQCQPRSIPYPHMGINLADAHQIPWVNLWHQINPWHSLYNNGAEFGPDGWPTAGRRHRFIAGADVPLTRFICPAGVYKVSWKGGIAQIIHGGGQPVQNGDNLSGGTVRNFRSDYPEPGHCSFEIDFSQPPTSIEFYIDGHIEEVRIVRPGFELDDTRVLHPKYTDVLRDFRALRFMGFLQSNSHAVNSEYQCDGPSSIDWNDRANPNLPQSIAAVRDGKGAAWEYVILLCNELDKDAWINVPIVASDDYVRGLARLFRERLKPTLNVVIELGNETWNTAGGFCCFRQIQKHFCGDDWGCHRTWPARRLKEIIDIFAGVFGWGEINNRIRGTLCGQIGYGLPGDGWLINSGLSYLENTYGAGTVRKYLYAVGAGPYFNTRGADSNVDLMISNMEKSIDEDIFGLYSDEYHSNSDQYMGNKLEGWLGEAGQYGLKLYAYEGGPDLDYTSGGAYFWDGSPNKIDKDRAMRDPRMIDLCVEYWTKWYGRYGYDGLFCFFLAQFNNNGLYTLGEHLDTLSTRQIAINRIVTSPAPDFDTTIRHVIPDTIDARKVAAWWSGWDREPALLYKRGEISSPEWHPPTSWIFAARKNGTYRFSVEQASYIETDIDVYIDGRLAMNLRIPPTGGSDEFRWSHEQDVEPAFDLSYGIHVLRFNYRRTTDCNIKTLRFILEQESPPFPPEKVMGDLYACLGNPLARYFVDIDQSVCEYEWDEAAIRAAGARLLPPAGGAGSVRSGQGTDIVFIDWTGVPEGEYALRVRGTNDVGSSEWRSFTVRIGICGFTIDPGSGCVGQPVVFTPHSPPDTRQWFWNFGPSSTPYEHTDLTGASMTASYSTPGSKAVQLTITNEAGEAQTFTNTLVIGEAQGGAAAASAQLVNAGEAVVLTVSGHRGFVIRWERSRDGERWVAMPGVDLPYTTDPLTDTTWFRAVVREGGCAETPSQAVRVDVANPVSAGRITPQSLSVCAGADPGTLTLEGAGGGVVRWEFSVAPFTAWTPVSLQSTTCAPGALSQNTRYRALVSLAGQEFASEAAEITVLPAMAPGAVSGPRQACPGQSGLVYSVQPVDGAESYTWTVPPGAVVVSGGNTSAVTLSFTESARSGRVAVTVDGPCGPAEPSGIDVSVGSLVISRVSFREPSVPGAADGALYVHFTEKPQSGYYTVDVLNRQDFSRTGQLLPGDSLFVGGFDDGDSIVNVTVRHQTAPCPSQTFQVTHVFAALHVPRLAAPVPVPGGGSFREDTLRIFFAPTEERAISAIYWTTCSDTSRCRLTPANRMLYNEETGVLLTIGHGSEGIIFQAVPLVGYAGQWDTSATATAFYLYRPLFLPVRGAYFDADADGHIDSIRFFFDRDIQRTPPQVRVSPPSSTAPLGIDAVPVTPVRESPRVFHASFAAAPFAVVETGFNSGPYASLIDQTGYFSQEAFEVGDSVAPVLISARYVMAGYAAEGMFHDTLVVEFSETVHGGGLAPFVIEGFGRPLYLHDARVDGNRLTALVQVPEIDKQNVPYNGQRIYIETGQFSSVTDLSGNRQDNPDNRRVAIRVVAPADAFKTRAGPTLVRPGETVFTVTLSPNDRIGSFPDNAQAGMVVSDALGNIVFTMRFERENNGSFAASWDGRAGRQGFAGQGTYVAVVTTTINGVSGTNRIKIGVER